jgi:hypothetical protein
MLDPAAVDNVSTNHVIAYARKALPAMAANLSLRMERRRASATSWIDKTARDVAGSSYFRVGMAEQKRNRLRALNLVQWARGQRVAERKPGVTERN